MFPREVISAGPLILRPPAERDVEAQVRACADPETVRFLPELPVPYTARDARDYLRTAEAKWRDGGAEFTVTGADGGFLGSIGLRPPDVRGNVEIGYVVAPWARGRGVATTAARAVTDWAFGHGVGRVELLAELENLASLRVAYAAGFTQEGRLRRARALRDGRRADLVSFGRLAGEGEAVFEPYLPFFADGYLSDGVVRLAPMTVGDAADYSRMLAVPSVAAYTVGPPTTPEEDEQRCRHTGWWWLSGQRLEVSLREEESGAFAGHLQLSQVVPVFGQAMVGYSLMPGFRGKGLMTRAVRMLVDWAFENTALHRIVAGTDVGNLASQRVLERAGFSREYVVRELFPREDGSWADDVEWLRLRPEAK